MSSRGHDISLCSLSTFPRDLFCVVLNRRGKSALRLHSAEPPENDKKIRSLRQFRGLRERCVNDSLTPPFLPPARLSLPSIVTALSPATRYAIYDSPTRTHLRPENDLWFPSARVCGNGDRAKRMLRLCLAEEEMRAC